jgi:two-component system response regulator YesN
VFRVWIVGPGRLAGALVETPGSFSGLFEALWEFTYRYSGLNLSGGASRALRGWENLPLAWTQAQQAAEHCFRSGNSLELREQVPELTPLDLGEVYQAVDAFRREVPQLDSSRLQELAQRFLERLATSVGTPPATMVQLVWDFLHPLRERLALRALGNNAGQDWGLATGFEAMKAFRSLSELGPAVAASIEATVMRLRNSEAARYRSEISSTIRWIEDKLDSTASVEEAARRVNMSESHFAHVFKEETGLSFLKFLIRRKMDRATELLLETDLLVYEVAEQLGYENPNHFSTLFKQTTGLSPQELRSGRNLEKVRRAADGRFPTPG